MPIRFTCPHCGATSTVDDRYAGQTGPCASCGESISIPDLPSVRRAVEPDPAATSSSKTPVVLIVAIAVGALALVAIAVIGILVALLLPAVNAAREAARRTQCINNLRQIGTAMAAYEADHGTLPPAYLADENGNPMHSWRVLILPYLGQQALYDQYDLEKPWDSPENLGIAQMMPAVFACPSDPAGSSRATRYVIVGGPGTIFEADQGCPVDDITDGLGNTILVVESSSSVPWTQPTDLDAATMSFQVGGGGASGIGSSHTAGANAAFADGSVRYLRNGIDPATVRAMTTRNGGETVPNVP